jgi:hypothetical protein
MAYMTLRRHRQLGKLKVRKGLNGSVMIDKAEIIKSFNIKPVAAK